MTSLAQSMTVDKSGDRIRTMFGRIAGRYDFLNHLLTVGIDVAWRRWTVDLVPPQGTAPILDVCTGTGDLAIAYWERTGRTVEVIGSDFTQEMLTVANEKKERLLKQGAAPGQPLSFLEADTLHLPFPDDKFQIVSVAFGLRNVSDTVGGIREMLRVCQPGGRVAILEFSQPQNSLLGAGYRWYFKSVLPRIGQFFSKSEDAAYHYLPQSVAEFPNGEALAELMRSCGLVDVQQRPFTIGICTLYWGTKPAPPAAPPAHPVG